MLYDIYAGIGGGYGGANYIDTLEFANEEEAVNFAYIKAIEEFDSYVGDGTLLTHEEIAEEEGLDLVEDADIIDQIYNDQLDEWIDYYVSESEERCPYCGSTCLADYEYTGDYDDTEVEFDCEYSCHCSECGKDF